MTAAAFMASLRKLLENSSATLPSTTLEQTLTVANRAGIRIASGHEPRPNGGGGSPLLQWNGIDGGTMVSFDRSIYCELSGYGFELDSFKPGGPSACVALDVDGWGGTQGADPYFYGYGSQSLFERLNFHAHRANPQYVMLRISETAKQNQEYHDINKCNFFGGDPVTPGDLPVGTGLKNGDSFNAKAQSINGCSFTNFGIGVHLHGGSAHMGLREKNSFTRNAIDILREGASEPSFSLANSEHSLQHLVDKSGYGFTIKAGTRLDPASTVPGTSYIVAGQALCIEGDLFFDARPPKGATLFDLSICKRFIVNGLIHFAPGTTFEETGLDSFPMWSDGMLWAFTTNVVMSESDTRPAIPPLYVRGKMGFEVAMNTDAFGKRDSVISMLIHAKGGVPNVAAIAATVCVEPTAASGCYAGLAFDLQQNGGAPAESVVAIAGPVP